MRTPPARQRIPRQQLRTAVEVPVIETSRVKLRGHKLDDFAACAAMWADPVVTRYIGGKPLSKEEVWARVLRYVGHWTWLGFGHWAVEDKASGDFIGEIGFADFKREIEPSIEGVPEIGWVLASQVHGKGYATEAVSAVVAWGDKHFGKSPTVCLIHPENVASMRVAEKCGYHPLQQTMYKGQPTMLLAR